MLALINQEIGFVRFLQAFEKILALKRTADGPPEPLLIGRARLIKSV